MPSSDILSIVNLTFTRLSKTPDLKPFDCGDDDLNDFFHNDASKYSSQLLAVTYTFESDKDTIAFFSVSNDKIINRDSRGKIIANKLVRLIHNAKRRKNYPAVKVGRLAVDNKHCGKGIGTEIINFIKHLFTAQNKTGCRFITVDAYNNLKVVKFYKDNGFDFLTDKDEQEETRLMYYDLYKFQPNN